MEPRLKFASYSSPALQSCKQWALRFLVPAPARVAALAKYLAVLAASFRPEERGAPGRPPSVKRRRLHLLYLLNDLLFHVKFRDHNEGFATQLAASLPPLFRSAAAFANSPKHVKKIEDLITLWEEKEYFPQSFTIKLRAAAEGTHSHDGLGQNGGGRANGGDPAGQVAKTRDAPYIIPALHGDPSTPWYDLPAGNWLPVLEPNSTRPMNPHMIKPLQLAPGPADAALVEGVKKLLADVGRIYAKDARLDADAPADVNPMGERIELDEITGEIVDGDTYYGWSRAFCERMKKRGNPTGRTGRDDSRGHRRSSYSSGRSSSPGRKRRRSSTRSVSRPALGRRRYSPASRSRSRSRDRRPPDTRSYSSRSDSRSRSRGRYRDASPPARDRYPPRDAHDGPRPRSPPYQRPPPGPPPHSNSGMAPRRYEQAPPPQPPPPPPHSFPPQHPQPPPFIPHVGPPPPQQGFDNYGGFPVPPPPPPNYHGQWPPPPPPPPPAGLPMESTMAHMPHQAGWFPPPAPPAPVSWGGGWTGGPTPHQAPPLPFPPEPPHRGRGGWGRGYRGGGQRW